MTGLIPASFLFMGGKAVLSIAKHSDPGILGKLCGIFEHLSEDILLDDFRSIQRERSIKLNGHLHLAFVKSVEDSVKQIKNEFKHKEGIRKSIMDRLSVEATQSKMLLTALDDTCEKVLDVFKQPTNIDAVFDNQVQISEGDQFFSNLIDLLIENGQKTPPIKPNLVFSKQNQAVLTSFIDFLSTEFFNLFTENFKKELKRNETAHKAYMIDMQHLLFKKQSQNTAEILSAIQDLSKPPLTAPLDDEASSEMDFFSYRASHTKFVGREDTRIFLNDFLNDDRKFRWMILTGKGGTGKSRLAYEVCKTAESAGWHVGFFRYNNDENYSFNTFSSNKNTLIVFDYAGAGKNFDDAQNAIDNLNEISRKDPFPKVRFLLLERTFQDYQLADLNDELTRRNFFGVEGEKTPKPYNLEMLSDEENWEIIQQIGGEKANEKEDLLAQISKIDDLKRPLFIFMGAQAFKESEDIKAWDKKDALAWYIRRLKDKYWRTHEWNEDNRDIDVEILNIIWLASIANYFTLTEIQDVFAADDGRYFEDCFSEIPKKGFRRKLASLFYGVEDQTESKKYHGLQPDLIAEYFILDHLRSRNGADYFDELLEIAWRFFPERAWTMLAKAAEDFPNDDITLQVIDWLITKKFDHLDKFFFDLGYQLADKGNLEKSSFYYSKAIELNPDFSSAYNNRGVNYYNEKKYDLAIVEYTIAFEKDPKNVLAISNRGKAYLNTNKPAKAVSDLTKALDLDPKDLFVLRSRVTAYQKLKAYTKALDDINRAIELDPKYAYSYNIRGNIFYKTRKFKEAYSDYSKAIELDPETPSFFFNRSKVHFVLNESEKALVDLDKTIELDPGFKSAYHLTGHFLIHSGEFKAGIRQLNEYWLKTDKKSVSGAKFILSSVDDNLDHKYITEAVGKIANSDTKDLNLTELPFYQGLSYAEFSPPSLIDKGYFFRLIVDSSKTVKLILNSTTNPIHLLNERYPLNLNADTVEDYLLFFTKNTFSENGNYQIIEKSTKLLWQKQNSEKAKYQELIEGLEIGDVQNLKMINNQWLLYKIFLHCGDLYVGSFKVFKDGNVEMVQDQLVVRSLPIQYLNAFGTYTEKKDPDESKTFKLRSYNDLVVFGALETMQWRYKYLDQSINKNEVTSEKFTRKANALIIACHRGHKAIVEWLLSLPNIDISLEDSEGKTALERAEEQGHQEIVDLLNKFSNT
ncbi:MAG: tetratricopeptide repeat protein [Bacteroidota bacterium]